MRKLIWNSSFFAFVPVLIGLVMLPSSGPRAWWSLAAGGAIAFLAFGTFLELAQSAVAWNGPRGMISVLIPVVTLLLIGCVGAGSMVLLQRGLLRPESFVAGLLSGTLFSQAALLVSSVRMGAAKE